MCQLVMSLSKITGDPPNYKKILYARSDLICFDSIFDQIESSTFKQYCQDLLQTASAL